jgi:non-ribosomal peptide synthetase component F
LSRGKQPAVSSDRRIDQIFAACANAAPDAEAIICGNERLTYRTLDGRAADLAEQLRSLGLRPGQVVALSLPRGPRAIAAMLAIMRCDCAFLPIDSTLPRVRQDQLLRLAAAELMVTADSVVRLPERIACYGPRRARERRLRTLHFRYDRSAEGRVRAA